MECNSLAHLVGAQTLYLEAMLHTCSRNKTNPHESLPQGSPWQTAMSGYTMRALLATPSRVICPVGLRRTVSVRGWPCGVGLRGEGSNI